jgi:hypothetical protein
MVALYVASLAMLPVSAQSVTATFALSPRTKKVVKNSTFDVSVNVKSTAAKEISYARAVLVFDPTMLQIPQAVEAGSMFCNYPTDEANYIADNTEGQLMITGLSTGEAGCAYPEVTSSGSLFVRVTFKAIKTGTAELSFMFNGREADGMSGITDTNSPPQFIMSTPQDGAYTIVNSLVTTTTAPPGNLGVDPRIVIGVAIGLAGIGWFLYPRKEYVQRVVATTEV